MIFRPIPGAVDAYAGEDGTIVHRGEIVEPCTFSEGGHLYIRGLGWLHQLVAAAYLGPRPRGYETRHQDGNLLHNHYGNLCYGTRRDNVLDAVRHGTHHWSSRDACEQGHEFTPENTYYRPSRPNVRVCRQCKRKWERERYHRRRGNALD